MLKWAVIKRTSEDKSEMSKGHLIEEVFYNNAIQITTSTYRRHSNTFKNHNTALKSTSKFYAKKNKEKCFTSTPIKIFQNHCIVFRDVSNQALKNLSRKIITKRSMQQNTCLTPSKTSLSDINNEKRSFKFHNKSTLKLNNFLNYKNSFHKCNTKPLQLEKCDVQKFLEQSCTCKSNYNYSSLRSDGSDYYSPTLPTLEIEDSYVFAPPDLNLNALIPEFSSENACSRYNSDHEYDETIKKKFQYDPINSSKFCDVPFNTEEKIAFVIDKVNRVNQLINFNKFIVDKTENYNICKDVKRSCNTRDLTFNIIVCTMIQKSNNINDLTEINKLCEKYSDLLFNMQVSLQKFRNKLNDKHVKKFKNTKQLISAKSNYLYDREKFLQCNIIDNVSTFSPKNFTIKLEKEICRVTAPTVDFRNTTICTYNEKYVDRGKKRSYSTLVSNGINTKVDEVIKCSLKRQNCVRRIKP